MTAVGRLPLYATTKAEGPVLCSKLLLTECDFFAVRLSAFGQNRTLRLSLLRNNLTLIAVLFAQCLEKRAVFLGNVWKHWCAGSTMLHQRSLPHVIVVGSNGHAVSVGVAAHPW
jgi:hypothetical protein